MERLRNIKDSFKIQLQLYLQIPKRLIELLIKRGSDKTMRPILWVFIFLAVASWPKSLDEKILWAILLIALSLLMFLNYRKNN